MKRLLAAVSLILFMSVITNLALASPTHYTFDYIGGATFSDDKQCSPNELTGHACILVEAGGTVSASIHDTAGLPIAGVIVFSHDIYRNDTVDIQFCGSTSVTVPSGQSMASFAIQMYPLNPAFYYECDMPSQSTVGTIEVDYQPPA